MGGKRFTKVAPAVWRSKRFLALQSDRDRLIFLFLLTCNHQTSMGAYEIPDGYVVADLNLSLEEYQGARSQLVEAGLIAFDEDTSTVYIKNWFKHCRPMNGDHARSCQAKIDELDSEVVREQVQADFDEYDPNKRLELIKSTPMVSAYPQSPADRWPVRRGSAGRAGRE